MLKVEQLAELGNQHSEALNAQVTATRPVKASNVPKSKFLSVSSVPSPSRWINGVW